MVQKVISGGQSGVDRAALDMALALQFPTGGWCPKGRLAEDGSIHKRYPLRETPSTDPAQRTEWNVRDSDGTLIVFINEMTGGTAYTRQMTARWNKPLLTINLSTVPAEPVKVFQNWMEAHRIATLNIAGPRENEHPGIYNTAKALLLRLLSPAGNEKI